MLAARPRLRGRTRHALEQHEHREMLVRCEAVLGAGLDEDGASFGDVDPASGDLERAVSVEDDVDLVVVVRLLAVRLWRDEDVDADLEAGRAVHDLVAAAATGEAALDRADVELVSHRSDANPRGEAGHARVSRNLRRGPG